jgi:hypothetical protein
LAAWLEEPYNGLHLCKLKASFWLRKVVDKLAVKHRVETYEVEEVLSCMAENNPQTSPSFASLDEMVEFFDTHDMGDYLEQMPEVHFEVNLQRRTHLIAIEEDLINKLAAIAKQEQMPAETLVNKWLGEKVASYPELSRG